MPKPSVLADLGVPLGTRGFGFKGSFSVLGVWGAFLNFRNLKLGHPVLPTGISIFCFLVLFLGSLKVFFTFQICRWPWWVLTWDGLRLFLAVLGHFEVVLLQGDFGFF